MPEKKFFYGYFLPQTAAAGQGGEKGIAEGWEKCAKIVSGKSGARYKGFKTKEEAERWLELGADYAVKKTKKLEPGIYFDAGTGRGEGVEISVTDEKGKNLLHKAIPKKMLNAFGKHLLGPSATNNYGELLAMKYALEIAAKKKIKKIFGDSRLAIEYWSKWRIKRNDLPYKTVELSKEVSALRKNFEAGGGKIERISGDDNPADLGFH